MPQTSIGINAPTVNKAHLVFVFIFCETSRTSFRKQGSFISPQDDLVHARKVTLER